MTTTTKRSTVVGVFHDRGKAEEAVRALRQANFREDQISLVSKGREGEVHNEGSHATSGAVTGVAAGAGAAALVSLGISFGVIPVIGPILAMGPLAAALLSAVGGAAAGGVVGGLIGLGVPEHEAKYYEGEVQSGRTIVTVHADGRYNEAWSVLERYGAYNHQTATSASATRAAGTPSPGQATRTGSDQTVQVREEELHAHKTPVQTGEVRVRKEVVTENKTINVPVQREEVVIERHAVSGRASSGDIRQGEEIRIPVKEEQVSVHKDTVVKEEVRVGKRTVQDTEQVGATLRKEQVKIERQGNVDVRGDVTETKKR